MKSTTITIHHPAGLTVEAASILAGAADLCSSHVDLIKGTNTANCRSLLNILSLSVGPGEEVELRVEGEHEDADMARLLEAIERAGGHPNM